MKRRKKSRRKKEEDEEQRRREERRESRRRGGGEKNEDQEEEEVKEEPRLGTKMCPLPNQAFHQEPSIKALWLRGIYYYYYYYCNLAFTFQNIHLKPSPCRSR